MLASMRFNRLVKRPVSTRVIVGAVLLVVVYRLMVYILVMRHVPLIGDEDYFWERSRFIVRWFEGRRSGNELERIVNRAWWMPGPMILVAPVRAVTKSIAIVRLWFGLVDLALLGAATWATARAFGRRIGVAFLLIVGLFPDTAAQSFGIWGEPIAAKLLILVLIGVLHLAGRPSKPRGHAMAYAMALGALLGAAIYFRPPLILQIVVLGSAIAVLGIGRLNAVAPGRWALAAALFVAGASATIAPWSIAASDQNGGLVLTTLSIDANAIHVFSNPEDLQAAAGGVGFGNIELLARERMRTDDSSYASALRTLRSELLGDVSVEDYVARADREVELYLDGRLTFLEQYRDLRQEETGSRLATIPHDLLIVGNSLVWYPLAWLTVYVMIRSFPLTAHRAFPAFLGKIALGALFVQPWVSNAKFRHLGLALPLMILLVLVGLHSAARDHPDPNESHRPWMIGLAALAQLVGAILTIGMVIVYLD